MPGCSANLTQPSDRADLMVRGPEIVGRAALADDVMVVFVGLFDAPI